MTRRKRYSTEFKREALRRANEEGVTDTLVAQELEIRTRQLRRWRDEAKNHGDNAFVERFYNRKRRHGYVGNISPVLFEKRTLGGLPTVLMTLRTLKMRPVQRPRG